MAGHLIAFEGLDQSGKQTQAERLVAALAAAGRGAVLVSFPDYESAIGRELGEALRGNRDFAPDVMQLLYVANRFEYRARLVEWLAAGRTVICDRYRASSLAYGEAQGLDSAWLAEIQRPLPAPDLTLLLDIAPETSLERKRAARDRFERDLPLLARVRGSYVAQSRQSGWLLIDGNQARDTITETIRSAVATRLGLL